MVGFWIARREFSQLDCDVDPNFSSDVDSPGCRNVVAESSRRQHGSTRSSSVVKRKPAIHRVPTYFGRSLVASGERTNSESCEDSEQCRHLGLSDGV